MWPTNDTHSNPACCPGMTRYRRIWMPTPGPSLIFGRPHLQSHGLTGHRLLCTLPTKGPMNCIGVEKTTHTVPLHCQTELCLEVEWHTGMATSAAKVLTEWAVIQCPVSLISKWQNQLQVAGNSYDHNSHSMGGFHWWYLKYRCLFEKEKGRGEMCTVNIIITYWFKILFSRQCWIAGEEEC